MKIERNKGFTLIEMMIAVAIIGILASIAIAQYQNYVARTQVSEALSLLTGARVQVEEFASQEGAFPTTAELTAKGIRTNGEFVDTVTTDDTNWHVIATFKNAGVNGKLQGNTVVLTRDIVNGNWACSVAESSTPSYLLPKSCL